MPDRKLRDYDPKLGILLVGHGTASEIGTGQFFALATQLGERLAPAPVEPGFLEIQQPDIGAGIRRLVARGAAEIVVTPLLLFAAGHAKVDIPGAVNLALAALPAPKPGVVQAAHLGCHPAILELSRHRLHEALAGKPPVAAGRTALVMVGRGSRDESATAEMHELAQKRHDPDVASTTEVCFLAMARPLLTDTLSAVAARGLPRVIVQPHLMFAGELADTVRRAVAATQGRHPEQEWLVAPLLADSQDSPPRGNPFLLEAIESRINEAIRVVASAPCD